MHTAREEAVRLARKGIMNTNDSGVFDAQMLSFLAKAMELRIIAKGKSVTQEKANELLILLGFSTGKAREIINAHLEAGTLLLETAPTKPGVDKKIYITALGSQFIKAVQQR